MGTLFIVLILWVCASILFAEIFPALIELCGYLIQFLCLCLFHVGKALFRFLGWLTERIVKAISWAFRRAGLFCAILIDEWRRGPQEEEQHDQAFFDEADDHARHIDAYEAALALLGLSDPVSRADLKRVYRQAMKAAHTDVGGRKEDAQALNAARDLVMTTHGWK